MKINNVQNAVLFFLKMGASVLKRENGYFLTLPGWNGGEIYSTRDLIRFASGWGGVGADYKRCDRRRAKSKREKDPVKKESMRKGNVRW